MIKLVNVSKYYNSSSKVVLGLRKINLELNKGEFVAITGESGSGKSTLLNVISGVDTYEDGELYFDNQPTSYYDAGDWEEYRKNKIGFIFQHYNLIESYTVLENVLSSIMIQNINSDDASIWAKAIIDKVGLTGKERNRASQLSSGQKQRLSIARALAKDTDVIIADEPTGNLDVENGKQIVQLLYEISKEKLVVMVTHNYDEVENYATRKIRMFDGEIQSNVVLKNNYLRDNCLGDNINNINEIDKSNNTDIKKNKENIVKPDHSENKKDRNTNARQATDGIENNSLIDKRQARKDNIKAAWFFAIKNIKAQPKKAMFLFVFFLFISFASYIFLGGFLGNLDDTSTKTFDNSAFNNGDKTRITVSKADNGEITDADVDLFKKVKYVAGVEKYGFVNDMTYAYRQNTDYSVTYTFMDDKEEAIGKGKDVNIIYQIDEFIKKCGKKNAAVTIKAYNNFIQSASILTQNDIYEGRLPEKLDEIVLCSTDKDLLNTTISYYLSCFDEWGYSTYIEQEMKVVGLVNSSTGKTYFSQPLMCMMSSSASFPDRWLYYRDKKRGNEIYERIVYSIDDNLVDNQAVISVNLYKGISYLPQRDSKWVMDNETFEENSYYTDQYGDLEIIENLNQSSENVINISSELFYKIYEPVSRQASVYIEDYAYMDYVLEAIYDLGYEVVSPYRLGSINYNTQKVRERLMTLAICLGSLIIIYVLEVIIIKALLKFKKKDFVILRFIGMNRKTIDYINYFELLIYQIISMVCSIVIVLILSFNNVQYILQIFKYYTAINYIIYIILNLITVLALAYSYNLYLSKNSSVTKLSEF